MSKSKKEEILDNWEELDDCELTGRVEKMMREIDSKKNNQLDTPSDLPTFTNTFVGNMMMPIQAGNDDDYKGACYAQQQAKMPMKILRRPTPVQDSTANNKPKQPIKTLKQREQEYAEARLRILGEAKNPEDDFPTQPSSLNTTPDDLNGKQPQRPLLPSAIPSEPVPNNSSQQMATRMPRGPNGAGGFIRR